MEEEKQLNYRIYLPNDPEGVEFVVDAKYADVKMRIAYKATEQGEKDLKDALRTFPKLIEAVRTAQTVTKEMAGLDSELDELLGDGE